MDKITPFLAERISGLSDKRIDTVSGAILLSDISGFTSMSESLAKEGKEGIEQLTRLLNNYFGAMLQIIKKYNGDVIKIGGDALLVGFYHNPTESDVKACASEMMTETDKFKGIKTCAGNFDISMKIVGKSGKWNELAPGDDRRREHFLCGRIIRELLLMEESAKRGDITIKWEEFAKSKQIKRKTISTSNLISYLPQGVSDLIDKGSFGEHRSVGVVFINLSGYNEESPETKSLQQLFKEVISITERYGGTIHKILPHSFGSNIMVLFGAPISQENDSERAVLASIELSKLNIKPLSLKVGVCSGFAYAGIVGSDWRKEYTVIGDTVNTSERLMETAKIGEPVVSQVTEHLTRDKIEYQELESIKVKGKEEHLKRFSPIGAKEEKYFKFEFVGREKETNEIIKAIKDGVEAIILKGEAGIGKSRFLYEIKNIATATYKVLEGYTDEIKGALHIFTSMISKEADIHPDDLESVRKEKLKSHIREIDKGELERRISFIGAMLFGISYPDSLYEKADARLRFENLCDALRYYIEYQRKPTVVIFDDMQWATKDDLKIIAYITRVLLSLSKEKNKISFVFSGRLQPDIIDNLPLVKEIEILKLTLQALPKESINLLADELLKNKPLPEDIARIVFERIEGNPFYLEQFLLDLIGKGLIKEKEDAWVKTIKFKEEDIPENIFSAIMARIDRLETKAKEAINVGSVIGFEFVGKVIETVLNEPESLLYLADIEKERLVYSKLITIRKEVEYIFRHAMIRDVVYESMLHERRKKMHKSVGEAIENLYSAEIERFYGMLAYHFNNAGEWEKAVNYNLKAGKKAWREYHNEATVQCFTRAAEIIGKEFPAKKLELYEAFKGLGDVYASIGSYIIAMNYYRNAVVTISGIDKEKEVDVLHGIADIYKYESNYSEALKVAEEACDISHKIKYKKGIAMSLNSIGLVHWNQGRYDEALKYYEESLGIIREVGDKNGIAASLNNIGIIHKRQSRYDEALKYYEESMAICKEIGVRNGVAGCLNNIGIIYANQGKYEEALKCLEESLEIRQEIGDKYGIAINLSNIGNIHKEQGRYAEALKYYEKSLPIDREIGDKNGISVNINNIGDIHSAQGQYEKAIKYYEESLEIKREIGDKYGAAVSLNSIGIIYWRQGLYDEALKHYEESLAISKELGDKKGIAESLCYVGDVYASIGLFDYGIQKTEPALSIFEEIKAKGNLLSSFASLIYGYTEIDNLKRAKDYIEKANNIEKETSENEGKAFVRLCISKFYGKEGKISEAIKYAEEALNIAKTMNQASNIAESYIQLCELWSATTLSLPNENGISTSFQQTETKFLHSKKVQEHSKESLSIAEKMKSLSLLWKSYYWLYKATGDPNYLNNTKDYLEEQFKHIPAEHLNAFKQYVKKYTKEDL